MSEAERYGDEDAEGIDDPEQFDDYEYLSEGSRNFFSALFDWGLYDPLTRRVAQQVWATTLLLSGLGWLCLVIASVWALTTSQPGPIIGVVGFFGGTIILLLLVMQLRLRFEAYIVSGVIAKHSAETRRQVALLRRDLRDFQEAVDTEQGLASTALTSRSTSGRGNGSPKGG